MNRLSIRQKILLLALLPVVALATISAWLFVSQARELRDLSRDDLRESLLAAKREQLANYMELALSAVAPWPTAARQRAASASRRRCAACASTAAAATSSPTTARACR